MMTKMIARTAVTRSISNVTTTKTNLTKVRLLSNNNSLRPFHTTSVLYDHDNNNHLNYKSTTSKANTSNSSNNNNRRHLSSTNLDWNFESTAAAASSDDKNSNTAKNSTSNSNNNRWPKPDFNNAQDAYEAKSTVELLTAMVTFSLCQIRPLVRHSESLLNVTRKVLGDRITDSILKATLFGHFCAGEDEQRIKPTIEKLEKAGIGSILDYAAEDDGSNNSEQTCEKAPAISTDPTASLILEENIPKVRIYDYQSEAECDKHVDTFLDCIHSVANLQKDGFAAIKVTALGNPKLLMRMSNAIVESKNLFAKFDQDQDGFINQDEFEKGLDMFFHNSNSNFMNELKYRLEELMPVDPYMNNDLKTDYITWSMLLTPQDLPKITANCRNVGPLSLATPTEEEVELIERMYERGHTIAKEAANCGVRLLIDAEQVRFQPAIDSLVLDLQRTYNAITDTDYPIIYNTYQCYLKDSTQRLHADVERSERYKYHFGAKLVRGAYMESERALALEQHYDDPIHDTIEDTHKCYNDAVKFLLEYSQKSSEQKVELMCATHNQQTIELAIDVMNQLNMDPSIANSNISFAQLYGMMDNLTYNLGKYGYRAYKYVPYGEIKMVMPYLIRRANENSSVASSATKELQMITNELKRRIVG